MPMINSGHIAGRVNFLMTLPTQLSLKLEAEAKRRRMPAADLAEKILEVVMRDGVVEAVLDGE